MHRRAHWILAHDLVQIRRDGPRGHRARTRRGPLDLHALHVLLVELGGGRGEVGVEKAARDKEVNFELHAGVVRLFDVLEQEREFPDLGAEGGVRGWRRWGERVGDARIALE